MDTDLSFSTPKTPEIIASSGISVRLWRLYAQAWLVCLVFPILYLVQTPLPPLRLLVAFLGLGLFVILYTWFMWPHPLKHPAHTQAGFQRSWMTLTGLFMLVFALIFLYGSAFLWLMVGVSAVVGVALSARSAFITVMGLTLLTLGLGVGMSGGLTRTDWLHLVPLVLLVRGLGLDMAGITRLSVALRELNATRSELARRAAMEERLRMARDLHDLLGHTLSLITLKSELAGRLIGKDSARAAQEIQEVERVARQALYEVREAVAGYRQPTLLTELDGARELLAAAGITCVVEQRTGPMPPDLDAVFAWTVREGVTNVIRHSRARQCTIRLKREDGTVWAEIINDGYREPDQNQARAQPGSGLSGLAERVTARGGQMEASPLLSAVIPSFRLLVELPMQESATLERQPK
jgi:two-component system, NarL family, sensor histidine kinase DesK